MVTIALCCYGNREMAHRAVERAFEVYAESCDPITEWTQVAKILTEKQAEFLNRNGIHTIMELCCFSRSDLENIDGSNRKKMVAKIEEALNYNGFEFRASE
jgi:hypothetical protein